MAKEADPRINPPMKKAIRELKGLIRERYPKARFSIDYGHDDPSIVHLVTEVDFDSSYDVVDPISDRLSELHTEENIPLYVIPIRPLKRSLAINRAQAKARANRWDYLDEEIPNRKS